MLSRKVTAPLRAPLKHISAFVVGALFAVGLGVSGMTQPGKVVGFLDFFGDWDPALMGVMGGGVLVNMLLYPLIRRRGAPLFEAGFGIPTRRDVDVKLILGAVLFGAGWGLAGFCPGPALTSLASGGAVVVVFVAFMVVGMYLEKVLSRRLLK